MSDSNLLVALWIFIGVIFVGVALKITQVKISAGLFLMFVIFWPVIFCAMLRDLVVYWWRGKRSSED